MLLSKGRLTRPLGLGVLPLVMLAVCDPSRSIAVEGAESRFCEQRILHDYLKPFQRMPKLHAPAASGWLGFGPRSIQLDPYPALIVSGGRVGYELRARPAHPVARPGWTVATTLARVDWRGRWVETVEREHRHVTAVRRKRGVGIQFDVGPKPAVYRVTSSFADRRGRALDTFGFYFRVIKRTRGARLVLNSKSYCAGTTVLGRADNVGTAALAYYRHHLLLRFDGSDWVRLEKKPKLDADFRTIVPGGSSGPRCMRLALPQGMQPGRYHLVVAGEFLSLPPGPHPLIADSARLSAEFEVAPG